VFVCMCVCACLASGAISRGRWLAVLTDQNSISDTDTSSTRTSSR
jgi:hypothetical protein